MSRWSPFAAAALAALTVLLAGCLPEDEDARRAATAVDKPVPGTGGAAANPAGGQGGSAGATLISPARDAAAGHDAETHVPTAGGACVVLADCPPGDSCGTERESHLPGGFCVEECDVSKPPPAGFTCTETPNGGIVQAVCTASSPCRAGYGCIVDNMTKIGTCEIACSRAEHCPTTGHCDVYSGFCRPDTTGLGLMEPCTRGDQCRGGRCFTTNGGVIPGFCATTCNVTDAACPEDGVCMPVSTDPAYTLGLCVEKCTGGVGGTCPTGFNCKNGGLCIPQFGP